MDTVRRTKRSCVRTPRYRHDSPTRESDRSSEGKIQDGGADARGAEEAAIAHHTDGTITPPLTPSFTRMKRRPARRPRPAARTDVLETVKAAMAAMQDRWSKMEERSERQERALAAATATLAAAVAPGGACRPAAGSGGRQDDYSVTGE